MLLKVMLILLIVVIACVAPKFNLKSAEGIRTITAENLKSDLETNADNIVVVNVLDESYYQDCHIAGSVNIPLAEISAEGVAQYKNKEKVVVYCAHEKCSASADAYRKLMALGFTNAYAYEGGMKEWKQKGFASEGVCQASYLQ